MCKKLIYMISVLVPALCLMSSAYAAEIVVVNEAHDYDNDGNQMTINWWSGSRPKDTWLLSSMITGRPSIPAR